MYYALLFESTADYQPLKNVQSLLPNHLQGRKLIEPLIFRRSDHGPVTLFQRLYTGTFIFYPSHNTTRRNGPFTHQRRLGDDHYVRNYTLLCNSYVHNTFVCSTQIGETTASDMGEPLGRPRFSSVPGVQ